METSSTDSTTHLGSPSTAAFPPSAAGEWIRLLAYPLFFASGAAGLIYEVVWTRMLLYVFGSGLYAVSAVLTSFMAGLALGSVLMGPVADRLRHPMRFYALLETAIACSGFMLPWAIRRLDAVEGWAYHLVGGSFAPLTALRFVASLAVLIIPTTLMGATLPVLSRALVVRRSHLGLRVGELYAINTAGAVAGALLAGFWLIGRYGVTQTVYTAAIFNVFAAVGAYALGGMHNPPEATDAAGEKAGRVEPDVGAATNAEPAVPNADPVARCVLRATFATGLLAMAAQVIWSRSLIFSFEHLKNTTYSFSAMLAVFLTGLAVGSALCGLIVDRHGTPARLFGLAVALTGVAIAFSIPVLYSEAGLRFLPNPLPPDGGALNWPLAAANIMAQSAMVLGPATFLMGLAFPAAARAVAGPDRVGAQVARLYAVNTLGAIVGPLAACFLIIPTLGLTRGLMAVAVAETAVGIWALSRAPGSAGFARALGAVCLAAFLLIGLMIPRGRGMQAVMAGESVVYHDEGPMATVSVVRNNFGYRTIYIDGVGVAGTDPMLQTDQKSLAHVPMLLADHPKAALTVGFGSGGASYSYLLHSGLERLDCAEICREVPRAAPHLTDANHAFLEKHDPRYRIVFDDARSHLRHSGAKYDVIATDCTDLRYKSNANLYDLQYFEFCRASLNPGGLVVVWMPLAGLSDAVYRVALRTFHRVFPEMAVMFMNNEPTHYVLLLGWRDKMEINFSRMAERLKEPAVKADLAELNLDDPVKLLSTWIVGGEPLARWIGEGPINTEDAPLIEFESPKFGYADLPILENLASMMRVANSPKEYIVAGTASPEDLARLERYERGAPRIVEGLGEFRKLNFEGAVKLWMEARAIAPEDRSLAALLDLREVRQSAKLGSPWAWLKLGRAMQIEGRADEAADCYAGVERAIRSMGGPRTQADATFLASARAWMNELKSGKGPASAGGGGQP